MSEYAVENGQEELEYVGSAAGATDVMSVADDIRKKLNIQVDWYSDRQNAKESLRFLKRKMENLHVLIMMSGIVGNNTRRKLSFDEFRAFTLVNKYAPLIFINSCDSDNGKVFSILHELAHVWVGENSFYNAPIHANFGNRGMEKFCNAVAAEVLVPTQYNIQKYIGLRTQIERCLRNC